MEVSLTLSETVSEPADTDFYTKVSLDASGNLAVGCSDSITALAALISTDSFDRSRIVSMEIILNEKDYMEKYKGHAGDVSQPLKKNQISKSYFVIKYTAKDGTVKHLDFWCTALDISKLRKMEKDFSSTVGSRSYDI